MLAFFRRRPRVDPAIRQAVIANMNFQIKWRKHLTTYPVGADMEDENGESLVWNQAMIDEEKTKVVELESLRDDC